MGISINEWPPLVPVFLKTNHANLQKSLDRISGRRITEPADDAGGLAVSMKLENTGTVLNAVNNNIANAIITSNPGRCLKINRRYRN